MSSEFPTSLKHCIESAADRFGKDLEALDWPSANKNAPCTEANATLNIAICLSNAPVPFHFYAEAELAASEGRKGGRIDLLGCNGDVAFALEAKRSGNIRAQADGILCDVKRLRGFKPSLATVAEGKQNDWWKKAKTRWGIVVVVSFENNGVRNIKDVDAAWLAKSEDDLRERMNYPSISEIDPAKELAFVLLDRELRDANAVRDIAPITDGTRWLDCAKGRLLWAAFPIS